ncbi:MAG TPA: hypothetical protein VFQ63_00125 [Patescibacteria group bacterium]|nr:hypothetical protein [Patescibacteria group bacterium]
MSTEHNSPTIRYSTEVRDGQGHRYGTLSVVENNIVGQGAYKTITGVSHNFTPLGQEKTAFLGVSGFPVTVSSRKASGIMEKIRAFRSFNSERRWMKAFGQSVRDRSQSPDPFLHQIEAVSSGSSEYQLRGIAFAQSLEDVISTMTTSGELLSDETRRFMLLYSIAKATKALEDFHSTHLLMGWNKEKVLTHQDVGQYGHLDNILLPGRGGYAVVIDYGLVEAKPDNPETRAEQANERKIFANTVIQRLFELGIQNLFPQELLSVLYQGQFQFFTADTLGKYATAELRGILSRSNETPTSALERMNSRFFVALLHNRILADTGVSLNAVGLEALVRQIDQSYDVDESPTRQLDVKQLLGPVE